MESEYFEDAAEEGSSNMGTAGKLLIMVGSLGVASIVGVYVHPHLLPLATEWVPPLWRAAQGWMTAPILFLLLNVVVGSLYVSSNMLSRRAPQPEEMAEGGGPPAPAKADDRTQSPDHSNSGRRAAPAPSRPAASTGFRARFEKSKTLTRLVRSKSEQIPPSSSKAAASGSGGRLKKAGTFEATPRSVVVVADPPEDAPPAGHEEVDKKAEAFISRFYHKVRLQRLDSLLRQQQQQQEQGRQ